MNDRIAIDPKVQHGKPVVRGTRVPVSRVLGCVAGGMRIEAIQADYDISAEDIRACVEFANTLVESQEFHPLPN